MNLAVLGLGNLIHGDDGVGIHAVRMLSADESFPEEVQIIDGGTLGLDLLPTLKGVTHLLVLDAVDSGARPGELSRFADDELSKLPISKSVHLLGFADLLSALTLLGEAPDQVVLLGIQPESTDWGVTLSPAVDGSVNDLVEAALAQILTWLDERVEEGELCVLQSPAR
jgi:hydrogenase maturation protease